MPPMDGEWTEVDEVAPPARHGRLGDGYVVSVTGHAIWTEHPGASDGNLVFSAVVHTAMTGAIAVNCPQPFAYNLVRLVDGEPGWEGICGGRAPGSCALPSVTLMPGAYVLILFPTEGA